MGAGVGALGGCWEGIGKASGEGWAWESDL